MLSGPRRTARLLVNYWRGRRFARTYPSQRSAPATREIPNPLEEYFDSVTAGPGIWKWRHYFDVYHRHLGRFVGQPIDLVEVGIYSGGSLPMWRSYFGPRCNVVGVDIEPACRQYERPGVRVLIGDQADRSFWARVRKDVPGVDVLIDDGGHAPEQQMVTLEEMLPHIRPGGVFICEDVHGNPHGFASFVAGLQAALHSADFDGRGGSRTAPFQGNVHSVHIYPFMVVIEKSGGTVDRFVSEKHGTEWQPFL